jgi:hypothetical protein
MSDADRKRLFNLRDEDLAHGSSGLKPRAP